MATPRATLSAPTSPEAQLVALAKGIPGYDSFATAGDEYVFDAALAARPIGFFGNCLSHVKGELARKRFLLEPWEASIVANVFGWVHRDTGLRRFREVFIYVPRKNGKSMIAAGLCVYVLFCDKEAGAEIYSAAAEREQAAVVFDMAKQMVLHEPGLASRCTLYKRAIAIMDTHSSYKPISSETASKHGYNPHLSVIDEVHAHKDRELIDVLTTGTGARAQPLTIYITTADYEREGSPCNELHDYATAVREGVFADAAFLPVLYQADKGDDWKHEDTWRKANPNYGISVKDEYIRRECEKAQKRPALENTFKRLHLNIRTEQADRWMKLGDWDKCRDDDAALDSRVAGQPCHVGVDLSSTVDLPSVALWFPLQRVARAFFWCPGERIEERTRAQRVPYQTWVDDGLIFPIIDRTRIDPRAVRDFVLSDVVPQFTVIDVAVDPWNSIELQEELADEGLDVVQFRQGFAAMNAPTKKLGDMVADHELVHDGNPVLRWMAANLAVETDSSENVRPTKKKSGDRIDGIVALIMAIGRGMVAETDADDYDLFVVE